MIEGRSPRHERYLLQLTDDDLSLLARCSEELRREPEPVAALRAQPALLERLLASPRTFEAVFGASNTDVGHFASPFLLFSVALHRTAHELDRANFVTEWFGPRQRMPIFDVSELRDFLADFDKRLYLSELLASYTHVTSGSMIVATRRGLRRQRFSELDLTRLASMTEGAPESQRPGLYRRLGDLTLFRTGVFPDHTALQGLSAIDRVRLLRCAGLRPDVTPFVRRGVSEGNENEVIFLLEQLGARWYRSAAEAEFSVAGSGRSFFYDLADHFSVARRVLNVLTDSFLFPWRSRLFGAGAA